MKLLLNEKGVIHISLSKANILALLHKVDNPASEKTISRFVEQDIVVYVTAEPDAEHYATRERGEMHPDTEKFIEQQQKGEES